MDSSPSPVLAYSRLFLPTMLQVASSLVSDEQLRNQVCLKSSILNPYGLRERKINYCITCIVLYCIVP